MPSPAVSLPSRSRASFPDCLGSPLELERFLLAQELYYADALEELAQGEKHTHWMWFVFPQLRGLGTSEMSLHYGIEDLAEARAYLRHPVLGPRLEECLGRMAALASRFSAREVLGDVDAAKLMSCVTLFERAAAAGDCYQAAAVLRCCQAVATSLFGGRRDGTTLSLLAEG